MQRFLPRSLAAAGATSLLLLAVAATSVPVKPVRAQSGFVLSGAADRDRVLRYSLDDGTARSRDRYKLTLPAQEVAVAEIQVSFEQKFDGNIDPDRVRVEVEREEVEVDEIFWSPEFNSLEVVMADPIPAGQRMQVIMPGARNPSDTGFYRIQGRVLGTEANPIFRYVGEWIVSIDSKASRRN